jgi:hypothetical protein
MHRRAFTSRSSEVPCKLSGLVFVGVLSSGLTPCVLSGHITNLGRVGGVGGVWVDGEISFLHPSSLAELS